MKKLMILFSALLISGAAYATVDNQFMIGEQFLVNTGYSAEMANLASVTSQDPYREPYKENKKFKTLSRRVYHYIVPGQGSDLDFYNHSGDYRGWSWKDY